jgi:hypothetical protein
MPQHGPCRGAAVLAEMASPIRTFVSEEPTMSNQSSPPPVQRLSSGPSPDATSREDSAPAPAPGGLPIRLRLGALIAVVLALVVGAVAWIANADSVDHWLAVYTGLSNLSGPYYGFWSGFGSDLAELTLIGAVGTAVYQLVRKYNCHYPGCWRVGNHPAAGGQFYLCWRHHPDYMGGKVTKEIIAQLHSEHLARQQALHDRVRDLHTHLVPNPSEDPHEPTAHPRSGPRTASRAFGAGSVDTVDPRQPRVTPFDAQDDAGSEPGGEL